MYGLETQDSVLVSRRLDTGFLMSRSRSWEPIVLVSVLVSLSFLDFFEMWRFSGGRHLGTFAYDLLIDIPPCVEFSLWRSWA